MSKRVIYTVTVPETSLKRRSGQASQRQELSKLTGLSGDGSVTQVGSNPGEFALEGQFHGTGAEFLAAELAELAGSEAIASVAFYDASTDVASAGYYTVEQNQNQRFRPQREEVADFSVRLARKGTRDSHRRYLRTNARQVTIGTFGSDGTEELGVPDAATKVVWIAEDKSAYEPATQTGTIEAEFGTVGLFDPTDAPASYDSPGLVYQLDYERSGDVDSAVFDDRGVSRTDGDGDFQWQQVFQGSHQFSGQAVFTNGVVRLFADEDANTLSAEEWDNGTSSWVTRSLNAANGWQVRDVDLIDPNPGRVYAQLDFEDTDDGSLYSLDMFLHRGWDNVQFAVPQTASGPIPSDLVTYLDPIASPRYTDSRGDKQLLSREVLRQ